MLRRPATSLAPQENQLLALVTVRVVAQMPTTYGHCAHCELVFSQAGVGEMARQRMGEEYPASYLAEYARLCGWLNDLGTHFGGQVRFVLVDPQSLGGVWLALRHRIRRYPALVINGRAVVGWDEHRLHAAIADALKGG